MESDFCVILVTAPDREVAGTIGRSLVEASLVACATLLPGATSIYRWENTVHEDTEVQMILKATRGKFDDIVSKIRGIHPYDVPEIIMLPITGATASYLAWIDEVAGEDAGG